MNNFWVDFLMTRRVWSFSVSDCDYDCIRKGHEPTESDSNKNLHIMFLKIRQLRLASQDFATPIKMENSKTTKFYDWRL